MAVVTIRDDHRMFWVCDCGWERECFPGKAVSGGSGASSYAALAHENACGTAIDLGRSRARHLLFEVGSCA